MRKLSKEVNKVYKTNDLSIFKNIKGNRPVNLKHVKRLTDSIKEHGMLQNPIIVNENMQVIDGQHRLLSAINAKSDIYYIVNDDLNLKDVHTLNLNQKNWNKKDFMDGYAVMGVTPYQELKSFCEYNKDYSLSTCIAFCNNTTDSTHNRLGENNEVFEDGTWKGRDFKLAQSWADKIRLIKPYYSNYTRSSFIGTMISLLRKEEFDLKTFIRKLELQPSALSDCSNRAQYKMLIEEIYNYKNRNKVNLRY